MQVYAIGEGGNGATSAHGSFGGGGGGGGAIGGETNLGGVTPGSTTLTITVGTGGTGTDTTVTGGSVTVTGAHGASAVGQAGAAGGAAGANSIAFKGGNGAAGVSGSGNGGAGGGSAGSTGAGGDASVGTGGTAGTGAAGPPSLAGAAGANGPGASNPGLNGNAPGPGASGGGGAGTLNHTGGTGAPGQVIIIWSVITISPQGYAGFTGLASTAKAVTSAAKGYVGFAGSPQRIAVVNAWQGTFSQPAAAGFIPPALGSVTVPLTAATSVGGGSGMATAGNWLFCIVGMNEPTSTAGWTVGDADDIHSFWRPGDVTTSTWAVSPAAGLTRTSVWYTPNTARQVNDVYVAPGGCLNAITVLVIEVQGLGPWDVVTGIATSYAAAATSLGLALAAPSAQAFLLAATAGDLTTAGQALAPSGWTPLPTVSASNGTDHTADSVLTSAYLPVTSSSASITATASSATDLSGVIIGVLTSAPSPIPAGANPAWPGRVILEAALGAGMQTPPDQCTWTALSDNAWTSFSQGYKRLWGWNDKSGIPWGLGQYQSASGAIQLDNADGALSPSNVGSRFYSTALNANMSFQSGAAPWAGTGNATLAQSSAQAFASAGQGLPMYSLQITPDGVTALPGAASEQVPVAASTAYSVSAWVYSGPGYAAGAQAAITWYTSSHTVISTTTGTAVPLPAATWTQVTLLGQTSPSNAAYAVITVQAAGTPAASRLFYAAEAALAAGSSAVKTGLVTSGTPVRLRMALGTVTTREGSVTYDRWYVWQRNTRAWPEKRNKALRGFVEATTSDAWSAAVGTCPTTYRGEVEQDSPYAWWPGDDQLLAGGVLPTALRNAATGNTSTLAIVKSPNGTGPTTWYSTTGSSLAFQTPSGSGSLNGLATYTVAADSGWMYGDPQSSPQSSQSGNPVTAQPGSAAWQATGQLGNTGSNGWFLSCNDPGFPGLSGGVTAEGWFSYPYLGSTTLVNSPTAIVAQQPYCPLTLLTLATGSAPVAVLQLDTSGHLSLITYNGGTGTSHSIYSGADLRTGAKFMVQVLLTTTTWRVLVNGGHTADVSGTATGMTSAWSWLAVNGDFGSSGGSTAGTGLVHGGNMSAAHLAIYPGLLPAWRLHAHYWAAITGFGLLPAPGSFKLAAVQADTTKNMPDGVFTQSSGGYGGSTPAAFYSISGLAAAQAGSVTSGPSAWAVAGELPPSSTPGDGDNIAVTFTGLAPSFALYNATQPGAETHAGTTIGNSDDWKSGYGSGTTSFGAGHSGSGSGASPPAAATATGDTVAQRIERVLGYGSMTVPMRAIDPASLMVQAAVDVGGQATGGNVTNIVQSDNGWLFTDNVGVLNYRQRSHLASDAPIWNVGMNVPSGYMPFAASVVFDNDPTRVFTNITVTPYSPDGASLAELVPSSAAAVTAAQQQFTPQAMAVTSYLQSTAEMQNAANWLFGFYGALRKRIAQITIDAASHPAAWGLVLGLNLGDIVSVYDVQFGAPTTTAAYRVSSVTRNLSYGANGSQVTGSVTIAADPLPSSYWT